MADPGPPHFSLPQTSHCTVTLPQYGAFVKGLFYFKIHFRFKFSASTTRLPELLLKTKVTQLPTTCFHGSSHPEYL